MTEDIIVTATRRATRLQETPISVSAVTGEELERNNIRQFADLESMLPNVRVPDGLNGGGNSITIRGITAQAREGTGIEQPAGAYLDQVYYGPRGFLDRVIFDIDRIEVLRGPQGTLWGRNAASGAISYTTRRPTASLDGYVRATLGNFDLRNVEGAISGPIVDDLLKVRLSGVHFERDGYTRDVNGGSFGTENQDAVRAQFALTPAEGFDLVVIGQYLWSKRRPDAPLWYGLPGFAGPPELAVGQDFRHRRAATDGPGIVDETLRSVTAIVTYALGKATLTSVTGYFVGDLFSLNDDEGSALDLAVIGAGSPGRPDRTKRFTQELRLATPRLGGVVEATLGGYYYLETTRGTGSSRTGRYVFDLLADLGVPAQDIDPGAPTGTVAITALSASRSKTRSYAAFGQANAYVRDDLWLTAGMRLNYEKKNFSAGDGVAYYGAGDTLLRLVPVGALASVKPFEDTVFTPMAGINYKPSERLFFYFTYSQGYKSGGFNTSAIVNPTARTGFGPERVTNYEAGARTEWFDRRLTVNLTGFVMDYADLQVERQRSNAGVGFTEVVNAGRARSQGVELETIARVTPDFQLNATAAYLDAHFVTFATDAGDFSGNRLPFAPRFSGNLGARYDLHPSPELSAYVQGNVRYSGSYFLEVENRALGRQAAHALVDARVGLKSKKGWELGLWARNLTNHLVKADYNSAIEDNALIFQGSSFYVFAPPRTFGADFTLRF
ncbi:TonB-dependent receptor [Sphingomonas sp. CGMCC 1.13658]|uniref:TonB-dependent receptor n=1 Tax=Sphingomonas sp. CGMCC 1.13658 TaxID=2755554 RepID=UPI0015EC6FF8|nr:TonB-dependent receptor [Sphingomonas sp. CGMCC 1.13658]MBA2920576.1 TonB-dependent receptor [Sphingomonas sp. CGMCC 1.13658]